MKSFIVGSGRTCLKCEVNNIGSDYDIRITCGEAHIGCVALVSNGVYSLLTVNGHKEDDIVQPLAKKLCEFKDLTFVIEAGVHIDNISFDEIGLVLDNNKILLGCWLIILSFYDFL